MRNGGHFQDVFSVLTSGRTGLEKHTTQLPFIVPLDPPPCRHRSAAEEAPPIRVLMLSNLSGATLTWDAASIPADFRDNLT